MDPSHSSHPPSPGGADLLPRRPQVPQAHEPEERNNLVNAYLLAHQDAVKHLLDPSPGRKTGSALTSSANGWLRPNTTVCCSRRQLGRQLPILHRGSPWSFRAFETQDRRVRDLQHHFCREQGSGCRYLAIDHDLTHIRDELLTVAQEQILDPRLRLSSRSKSGQGRSGIHMVSGDR